MANNFSDEKIIELMKMLTQRLREGEYDPKPATPSGLGEAFKVSVEKNTVILQRMQGEVLVLEIKNKEGYLVYENHYASNGAHEVAWKLFLVMRERALNAEQIVDSIISALEQKTS